MTGAPAAELHEVRRRGLGTMPEADLAARVPVLSALARRRYGTGAASPPPLRALLGEAVALMGVEELRAPAAALFGVSRETFGKAWPYRLETAARRHPKNPAPNTFRQGRNYVGLIIEELTAALAALDAPAVPAPPAEARIDRPEALAEAGRLLSGTRLLWLWGEAGTGKTVLARQIADRVRGPRPAAQIRLGNSRVTESDVLAALAHGDADASSWSAAACRRHLRGMLADGRALGAVIMDGAGDPDRVREIVPPDPRVPVVVTARTHPPAPFAGMRVGAYGPAETAAAIGALLPGLPAGDRDRIAAAVAHHPLVLDRVCRYLAADPGRTVPDVVAALSADTSGTLDALDALSGAAERLSVIHRRTLEELRADAPDAVRVLAALVWTAGEGTVPKDLADDFLRHLFPGPAGALTVAAAEAVLSRWALVAVEADAFVMHPLTARILQRLLAGSCQEVLTAFFAFLRAAADVPGRRPARLIGRELAMFDGTFGDSWGRAGSWLALDEKVWLAERRTGPPRIERYEVLPDGIQMTTGPARGPVTGAELADLVAVVSDYERAAEWLYLGWQAFPAQEVSEPDGLSHRVRKGAAEDGGIVRALCGKRWRPQRTGAAAAELPSCPRCAAAADWGPGMIAGASVAFGHLRREAQRAVRSGDADAAAEAVERLRAAPLAHPVEGNAVAVRQLAGAAFELFQQEYPSPGEAVRFLGVAETWYRVLAGVEPAEADHPWRLGQVIVTRVEQEGERRGEGYAEAAALYRRSLDLRPGRDEVLWSLGNALIGRARYAGPEEEERLYRELEHRTRHSPGARRGDPRALARIAFALRMRALIFAPADPALADRLAAESAEWGEALLRKDPDDPDALYRLGAALADRGRFADARGLPGALDLHRRAEEVLRRAVERAPENLAARLALADAHEGRAIALGRTGQKAAEADAWAAAARVHDGGLATAPDDPDLLAGRGWCHYHLGRLAETGDAGAALEHYDRAAGDLARAEGARPYLTDRLCTVQAVRGQLLERTGDARAAEAFARTAETARRLLDGGRDDPDTVKRLAYALVHRANLSPSADPAERDALYVEAHDRLARVAEREPGHIWAWTLAAAALAGRAGLVEAADPALAGRLRAEASGLRAAASGRG
ncbi:tetratricopeptide repeat protein [Actinomadura parmotrematis]|uniref:ATP-binding protein n=1 Tax=Actinomadura parmotrematis TaxID=2864039 RepID=A0ABS7FVS4_9ACTN|nr:DUF3039 domain-containing protein [Actinomadura parmotrematis]MBW8484528.1 ATP-binding protein [Actinomadura parmotrematis]